MKIGIISDTHDDILNTNKAIDIFSQNNVSIVIHAGDFVAPPVVTEFKRLSKNGVKIIGVLGNNDGEARGLKEEFDGINGELFKDIGKIKIDDLKFGIYHGTDVKKRPLSAEEVDGVFGSILTEIRQLGEREIASRQLGEIVMRNLKRVDQVAYVRFASVYRDFQDIKEFADEISSLSKEKPKRTKKKK